MGSCGSKCCGKGDGEGEGVQIVEGTHHLEIETKEVEGPRDLEIKTEEVEGDHHLKIETVRFDLPGLKDKISAHLAGGNPILAPSIDPGPYVVIAPHAGDVGLTKGRSSHQLVARMVSSFEEIKDLVDLNLEGEKQAKHYLEVERMTVLMPVHEGDDETVCCEKIEGGIRSSKTKGGAGLDLQKRKTQALEAADTFALFWRSSLPDLSKMCSQDRPLFVSSGNLHGLPMGQSFQEVIDQFKEVEVEKPLCLLAIDGDALRVMPKHESTSMVRISCKGEVKITRKGYHHLPEYEESKCWRATDEDLSRWTMKPAL